MLWMTFSYTDFSTPSGNGGPSTVPAGSRSFGGSVEIPA